MSQGGGNGKLLHLISDPDNEGVAFLVSPATLNEAHTAPYPDEEPATFGELRCTDDLEALECHLGRAGVDDLETYIAAIERSAGRVAVPGDLAARLLALRDVDFQGESVETDDTEYELPGDVDGLDFHGADMWAEPYWRVVYDAMRDAHDIPDDLKELHISDVEGGSPLWWGRLYTSVIPGHLDALIVGLEARGFTIVHEPQEAP